MSSLSKPGETPSTVDFKGGYFGVLFDYVAGEALEALEDALQVKGLGVEEEAACVRQCA